MVSAVPLPRAGDVRAAAGITQRQLDHWRSMGLIWPAEPGIGSGNAARFDPEDVAWIAAIAGVVRLGLAPSAIAIAAKTEGVSAYAAKLRKAASALESSCPNWLAG